MNYPLTDDALEGLRALARKIHRQEKERRKAMTPRSKWSIEEQLEDIAEHIEAKREAIHKDRDGLRATVDTVTNSKLLSPFGRQEKLAEALAKGRANLPAYRAAADRAHLELERRAALTGTDRVLRAARYVPPAADDDDKQTKYLADVCEVLTRREVRDTLLDAPVEDLTAAIREADATQQHAALCIAEQVLARRKAAGESLDALNPASSALIAAREHLEPPRDVKRLEALFQRIAAATEDVEGAITELATGQESQDIPAKSRRISELAAQGLSPEDAALVFAAERDAERTQRAQRAAARSVQIVDEAIRADEGDAAAMTNGTNNPAA